MENQNTNVENAQGAETTGRKQKVSTSYTLRAFGENVRRLKETGLLTVADEKKIGEVQQNLVQAFSKQLAGLI